MKKIKIEGKRFGQLLVLHRVKDRYAGKTKHLEIWYRVKCDCGKITSKRGYMLRDGRVNQCGHARGVKHGLCKTKEYQIWNTVKSRADAAGIKFTLEILDIRIPKICPLLGIPIRRNNKVISFNSPSIDRINNDLGYVKDNIWIISHKANAMKSNASLSELQTLVRNLEKKPWLSST
jgi:hypothetical protein